MAQANTIGRLHEQGKLPKFGNSIKPQSEPVKTDILSDSQPDLLAMQIAAWQYPARRRFGPQGRLAAPPMMNSVMPTNLPTDRADFAALAAQDRFRALLAKHPRRGADAQPWAAIQL
jgi:hypothetical protein